MKRLQTTVERTLRNNVRFYTNQTSLEIKTYRTQVCGWTHEETAGGYLRAEHTAPCLYHVVKIIMIYKNIEETLKENAVDTQHVCCVKKAAKSESRGISCLLYTSRCV